MKTPFNLLTCCALISSISAYDILVVMPVSSNSHYFTIKPLMETIAARGHRVTFLAPFVPKAPTPNLEYVTLNYVQSNASIDHADQFQARFSFTEVQNIFGDAGADGFLAKVTTVWGFYDYTDSTCYSLLHSSVMKQFLAEDRKFDLIMAEAFHTDCFLGVVERYKAPLMMYTTSAAMLWYHDQFGLPQNPSYIPNLYSGFGNAMSFGDRLQNTIINIVHNYYYFNIQEPKNYRLAKGVFGEDLENCQETVQRAAVMLVNSHHSILGPRPFTPGVIEVGGIHVEEPKTLPKNIEKWINESKEGVIYFSMGSMIKGHTFPEEKRKIFLRAFGRLKQRVLWKWENETMPDKPDNVMIQKWMPQFDILSHPNVKAFISHGGLLGTTEAVHCGVPVVVMPQFGDQHTNARALEAGGGGVVLNFREADEEMVYQALKKVLDPEFNKKAKELSARFRDRPMSPMDTAIYWIEYVARHKGAHHLRTAAVGMPLYQYLLLDVFGFLALCVLSALFIVVFITRMVFRMLMGLFSSGEKKQKKQKKQ